MNANYSQIVLRGFRVNWKLYDYGLCLYLWYTCKNFHLDIFQNASNCLFVNLIICNYIFLTMSCVIFTSLPLLLYLSSHDICTLLMFKVNEDHRAHGSIKILSVGGMRRRPKVDKRG